jgi:hypothetical protein
LARDLHFFPPGRNYKALLLIRDHSQEIIRSFSKGFSVSHQFRDVLVLPADFSSIIYRMLRLKDGRAFIVFTLARHFVIRFDIFPPFFPTDSRLQIINSLFFPPKINEVYDPGHVKLVPRSAKNTHLNRRKAVIHSLRTVMHTNSHIYAQAFGITIA